MSLKRPNVIIFPKEIVNNLKEFSGCELKILIYIFSKTYGDERYSCSISLKEFTKEIGASKTTISQALTSLEERRFLDKVTFPENNQANEYILLFKEPLVQNLDKPCSKIGQAPGYKLDTFSRSNDRIYEDVSIFGDFKKEEKKEEEKKEKDIEKERKYTKKERDTEKEKKEEEKKEERTPHEAPQKTQIPSKIQFYPHVFLTEAEFTKLISLHGENKLKELSGILEAYKGSTGKKYKSDYHTLLEHGWVSREWYKIKNFKRGKFYEVDRKSSSKPEYERYVQANGDFSSGIDFGDPDECAKVEAFYATERSMAKNDPSYVRRIYPG